MLLEKITHEEKRILQKSISAANQLGIKIYLVGGIVRDLILSRPFFDLDLAVEGNAIEYAQFLSPSLGGEVKKHANFLSATIILPSQKELDITTTRKETYPTFGALPQIEPGDIFTDLKRRDFSINALAINLNSIQPENILDPYGGLVDLDKGLIKILHQKSFMEDPIRIFRAARLMHRLKFNLEENTSLALKKGIPYIKELSGKRTKVEFQKIISEGNTLKILRQLNSWGVMPYFLPGTNIKKLSPRPLDFIKTWCGKKKDFEIWLVILMLIYWETANELKNILNLNFIQSKKEVKCVQWLMDNSKNIKLLINSEGQISFLKLHKIMYNMPEEIEIFILSLLGKNRYGLLSKIKLARKGVNLPLDGKDVLKKGFNPGPVIGQILNDLELEVIKGNIITREEALEWLEKVRGQYVN